MKNHKQIHHCLYADDFYLFAKTKNPQEVQISLNKIFIDLNKWCKISGASISQEKSKHLHICRKNRCSIDQFQINSAAFTNVKELKVLGLIFNKTCNWNSHIAFLAGDLSKRINILKSICGLSSESHVFVTFAKPAVVENH